jgi:hypothetical protein
MREVRLLASLQDENISRVLAVSATSGRARTSCHSCMGTQKTAVSVTSVFSILIVEWSCKVYSRCFRTKNMSPFRNILLRFQLLYSFFRAMAEKNAGEWDIWLLA